MLDRLPVELLSHTLSFVDPLSSHRLPKPASLYACCLVSKRVKEAPQPLLWRAVVVDKKGEFEAVKREVEAGGLGQHVRILEANGEWVMASELSTLVQSFSFSVALLYQLDILQLSLQDLHLAKVEVIQHPTTLFSGTIYDLGQYVLEGLPPAPIKNLHIRPDGLQAHYLHSAIGALYHVRQYARDVLGKLAAFLPSSGITTLFLPIPLQRLALTAECDELLAACSTKGVEVLWEEEYDVGTEEFNEEFRRLVVKKKRDEAERAS